MKDEIIREIAYKVWQILDEEWGIANTPSGNWKLAEEAIMCGKTHEDALYAFLIEKCGTK